MSDRSGSPSDEGEGDEIRPHGDDRDSSDESSEEDPEEARRIAEGFIQDDDDDEDEDEDEDQARRRRRKEKKRRKRRERERRERHQAEAELSEDELELIQENRGRLGGPSEARPFKRTKREDTDDEKLPTLQDIFREDEERRALEDDDEDDMGDFIEDDEEEEEARGETEEQRRERRRAEKLRRREAARARPDAAGMDRGSWDEIFAVFGDGQDYDWALEVDEGVDQDDDEEAVKKDLRLEDVFDPAEIKAKRLQDEDKAIAQADRPERHQLVNSTLSDNPILTPDTLFPPPLIAAGWAYNKISTRTQYLFCDMHADGSWPLPTEENPRPVPDQRRSDLAEDFLQAVTKAFDMMFIQHLEVPFLWHYRRDEFAHVDGRSSRGVQFLQRDDLWTLYTLGVKLRAIHARCNQITALWSKIKERKPDIENDYLETILLPSICTMSVEAAAEGYDWLLYHYPEEIRQIKEEEAIEDGSKKLPERAKDSLRQGAIMGLVKEFGVSVSEIAVAFNEPGADPPPVVTSSRMPLDVAQEYCGEGTYFYAPEDALNAAKTILMTDFIKDPSIRQQSREWLQVSGAVTVTPTERGMSAIDDFHAYYTFKFLTNKPIQSFAGTPQFLHMLKAEEEGLITIEIHVGDVEQSMFYDALERCLRANDFGDIAIAWNSIRREICHDLVTKHLIPSAAKWVKEYLKTETEDYVADFCRQQLEYRVNVRPFATSRMEHGEIPSVLALSNGHGDRKDAVMAVMLDSDGNIRTQTKFDSLREEADRTSFIDLVERREPKVVVVGGFSAQAGKLRDDVEAALRSIAARSMGEEPPTQDRYASLDQYQEAVIDFDFRLKPYLTPTIVVSDDTARQYMHSQEAKDEFPTLPVNGRYALALARYTQNPLNAYCKLGQDIASVTFMEQHQKLIPSEKLLLHLERALVNSTCFMGIEINSCCASQYQRSMLPFVAGLGPRKADALVNGVMRYGSLTNRLAFSRFGLFGPTVFENAVGFLSIETELQNMMLEKEDPQDQPDPLDLTRIHPADYEFAQRMARDAMDQDADDVADQHDSYVVQQIMLNEDRQTLLNNLNLNDFALTLQRQGEGNRRYLLAEIVKELIQYRSDQRPEFWLPTDWEVLTMFTGETPFTVGSHMLVSATVRKALSKRVFCSLESGMDAILELNYTDSNFSSLEDAFKPKQTFKAVVVGTDARHLQVQLSVRAVDMAGGVPFRHSLREDPMNDRMREYEAKEKAAQRKRRKAGAVKRVVHHPNWHTMNSGQAEQFLASQQRGDVVIRPSSKGNDHLAVTWKVDDDVYQHIDVQEIDKPNEYSLGRILRIAEKYSYSDLDELIINHVKAIARKFDEVQLHDKYKPEAELEAYLKNYVQAHPGKSTYGLSIDSDRPGYLKLCFLNKSTKDGGVIQQWPVKVLPGAYQLHSATVPDVAALCNAFKAQYTNKLADQGGKTPGVRSGRTPMQGGRTPLPGGRTPAPAGSRGGATPYGFQPGRTPLPGGMTPNPYGAPQAVYGMSQQARPPFPPNAGPGGFGQAPPQNGYGGPPPPGMGGPPPGIGMNPERAAMLARQQQY